MVSRRFIGAVGVMLIVAAGGWSSAPQSSNTSKEQFTALAVNMAAMTPASATPVDITVEKWTSDETRDRLMTILKEQGPDELLKALQKEPRVGSIRTQQSLGYDLHYARKLPGADGGERIALATDRPIGFLEAQAGGQTLDYRFTLIELRVGPNGKGEGKMSIAARPEFSDHTLVIEDWADQPVRLQDVQKLH
jgi:hypothetical protein